MLPKPTSHGEKIPLDPLTERLIRTKSDEVAVELGDRFDPEAACFAIWWIERYCILYEGEKAGSPLILMSVADQPYWDIPYYFDWKDDSIRQPMLDRLNWHLDLHDSGAHMHWQYDFHIRLYGWQTFSAHYKRWVRRHRQGVVFIPKKNCKSPTLAADSLYLTMGDAEPGAKSYIMAKTGKQARKIAGQHIYEMFNRSEELKLEAKFNKTECRLYHEPTSSICEPLSSDNKKAREANEGINGNVCVDELHVVDRETVDIVSRAGISRAESIHLEVSTAGVDNSGYGRERFDYGLRIQNGEAIDTTICTAIYAADQKLQPENITEENVLEIAKAANPAWNHTINPDELLADFKKSQLSTHEMSKFMMYRLNIWRQGGDPFVRVEDWKRGNVQNLTFDRFRGQDVYCAVDMSEINDLAAWAWTFRMDDKVYTLVDHWLPRPTAIKLQGKIEYSDWEKRGEIRLLPGRVIDQDDIYCDVMARIEQNELNVKSIAYDPNRIRSLRQRLETEGFILELFRQSAAEFHEWVEYFEKLVIGHGEGEQQQTQLFHQESKILTWQIQHCEVDKDKNDYKRLIKPDADTKKKIDGIVAVVMSLRALELAEPEPESAYDSPNPEWLERIRNL